MVPFDNNFFMDFYGSTRHIFIMHMKGLYKKKKKFPKIPVYQPRSKSLPLDLEKRYQ